jgi:hypothetical protein
VPLIHSPSHEKEVTGVNVQRVSIVVLVLFAIVFVISTGFNIDRSKSEQSNSSSPQQPAISFDVWPFVPGFIRVSVDPTYVIGPFAGVQIQVPASSQSYRLARFSSTNGTPLLLTHVTTDTPSATKTDAVAPGQHGTLVLPSSPSVIQVVCEAPVTCAVSTQ